MILTYAKRRRKSKLTPFGTKRRGRVNMGRRVEKIVKEGENIIYIYRDYLQIASYDMRQADQTPLTYIIWAPTQPVATRPLVIRQDQTWYPYGWDAAKNITEIFTTAGQLNEI